VLYRVFRRSLKKLRVSSFTFHLRPLQVLYLACAVIGNNALAQTESGSDTLQTASGRKNLTPLLNELRISANQNPRWDGLYRALSGGDIIPYFMFTAFALAPESFTPENRKLALETTIHNLVVAPRENGTEYEAGNMVSFPSGRVYFANIAGQSAAELPDENPDIQQGQFLYEGSLVWEFTGYTAPKEWQWFIPDVHTGLAEIVEPDSNDAYAGMLIAAVAGLNPSPEWLMQSVGFGGRSRMDVLRELTQANMKEQLSGQSGGPRLARTFQHGIAGNGQPYDIRFLADNVEVFAGFNGLATLLDNIGATEEAQTARTHAASVRAGVLDLWKNGRFQTYAGQPGHSDLTGNDAFVTNLRFHLWPALYGMITSEEDTARYLRPALAYIQDNTPGLLHAELDPYPMSETYFIAGRLTGEQEYLDVLTTRVSSRIAGRVTLTDSALATLVQNERDNFKVALNQP